MQLVSGQNQNLEILLKPMSLQWGGDASALDVENYGYFDSWDASQWGKSTGYVAICDEKMLGCLTYALIPGGEKEKALIWICKILVNNNFRRMGIGRQLIDRCKDKATCGRVAWLTAFVPEDWLASQLFFQACGFRALPPIKRDWSTGWPAYFMRWRVNGRGPRK